MARLRRPSRRRAAALALLPALAVAVGCGADTEGPSDAEQVRAVVERFGAASRARDYQTICERLLSAELVRGVESVGLPCEAALERGLSGVRDPHLAIREISVGAGRALVSIHTTATGEAPSDDAMQLVREHDEWRIASLVAPEEDGSSTSPSTAVPPTVHG